MVTFVEKIAQLRQTMIDMSADKLFLINEKDVFDHFSINFRYPGGTITYCDIRGPVIQFKTNNADKLIDCYLQLIKDYQDTGLFTSIT